MAVLTNINRQALHRDIMSELSSRREGIGTLTKPDLKAAIDAIDKWMSDNALVLNAAIPLPARAQLTAKQKAEMLTAVIKRRWEVS